MEWKHYVGESPTQIISVHKSINPEIISVTHLLHFDTLNFCRTIKTVTNIHRAFRRNSKDLRNLIADIENVICTELFNSPAIKNTLF